MKKGWIFALAAVFVFLSACNSPNSSESESFAEASQTPQAEESSAGASGSEPSEEEPPLVPDFTLTAVNGESVSLSDYAGKIVVLNFWASWCPPCRAEMAEFQKLHDELSGSDEAVILMLNQTFGRETKEDADAFLVKNEYTFLTLYDEGEVGYSMFGIQSLPTTVVIDKDGYLSGYTIGQTTYDTVVNLIEGAK